MSSTDKKLLEQVAFYLDESIYSRVLFARMQEAGANVYHAGAAGFPKGSSDVDWLTKAGDLGMICLLRDSRIRYRRLERLALEQAGVGAFVFTGGQVQASRTADIIVPLLPKFARTFISHPRPFLYTFGSSGHFNKSRLRKKK